MEFDCWRQGRLHFYFALMAGEAAKLSAEQKEELTSAFKLFDKDDDGNVTTRELGAIMRSLGHPLAENELQQIVNEADEDNNGTIELDEFLSMMSRRMNVEDSIEDEIKAVFQQFDKNNDGLISGAELRYVMNIMGESPTEQDIEKMMEVADRNKDGYIDFEDFKVLIEKTQLYK
mmetsp:Transcript_18294/g.23168  ORF Transcript_18294/g.23168 Transcript_18294/m.23168 type:complete len:175 (-) Transcript_18294:29-553(-)